MSVHDHDIAALGRKSKKRVTEEQIDQTRMGLKGLSQSPYITREMAIKKLSTECLELLGRGYSYADLVKVFRSNNIAINETVLRDVLNGKILPPEVIEEKSIKK